MNSELSVNEAESFNEASEVRIDYLQHCLIRYFLYLLT